MSAFLYAAPRTPFGEFNGAPAGIRADDLAAVLRERKERYGIAATVVSVGQGPAVVLENLKAGA